MSRTVRVDSLPDGSVVAVASKVAVDDPAGIFTEAGTVSAGVLAEIDTVTPPVGAWAKRVTVQTEDAPASRFVLLQARAETEHRCDQALSVVICDAPLKVAVMAAV